LKAIKVGFIETFFLVIFFSQALFKRIYSMYHYFAAREIWRREKLQKKNDYSSSGNISLRDGRRRGA